MKLILQILTATIIGLGIYAPTVWAQANLTFSGGSGTPISITLQAPVVYTLTAPCRNPMPLFKNTGNTFNGFFPAVNGTMNFTIDGGAMRSFTVANSGLNSGDIAANDIFINYSTSGADPTLPAGTVFRLNAGTLTTIQSFGAAPPPNGTYTSFLVCASTTRLRTSTDAMTPTAAGVSVSGRVLTNTNNGLKNAVVQLTDSTGNTNTVRTSAFGYYRFEDVPAGQSVIITVVSKRYQFAPRVVEILEATEDLDFMAL